MEYDVKITSGVIVDGSASVAGRLPTSACWRAMLRFVSMEWAKIGCGL